MLKVLVIENDAQLRLSLVSIVNGLENIHTAGIVSNPMMAQMQIKHCQPDLVLLTIDQQDNEIITKFLTHMQDAVHLPIVMLSTKILPSTNAERLALRAGFATIMVRSHDDITTKNPMFVKKLEQHITTSVASFSKKTAFKDTPIIATPKKRAVQQATGQSHRSALDSLIAIGASTGGTEALRQVVSQFPVNSPAVVIVQHIPKAFAQHFIDKLEKASPMRVVSACDGMKVFRGTIYVGAGDEHFTIEKQGLGFVCRVKGKDKVNGHCPSVDRLFDSVALCAGSRGIGAIMTGMGDDGAKGLKKMRDNCARTVAQDKQSSVVWGMPGVAVSIGAAEQQCPLNRLGEKLIYLAK